MGNAAPEGTRVLLADRGDAGRRVDLVVCRHLSDVYGISRTRVQAWIESGRVAVNGEAVRRTSRRAAAGDEIAVYVPEMPARAEMAAESGGTPLVVLYEDDHLLALDKPPGIVVHPTYRNTSATIMNALLWYARGWPDGQRPALVGRLDKDTSGVLLVSKNARAHAALQRATAAGAGTKEYLAIVYGRVKSARGTIDLALGADPSDRRRTTHIATGAPSVTKFERLTRVRAPHVGLALLRCTLESGRRHQIRAHLAASGWPVVGDAVYSAPRWKDVSDDQLAAELRAFPRQALHAFRLSFVQPFTSERVEVEAPIPPDISGLLIAANLSRGVPFRKG